jgi:hypothetical protein
VPVIFLCHDAKSTVEVLVFGTLSILPALFVSHFLHVFHTSPDAMTTHVEVRDDRASGRATRHDDSEYSTGSSELESGSCSESGDSDTEGVLSKLVSSPEWEKIECPKWDEIKAKAKESATVYPEPEGDDGSLASVSKRVYTPINGLWQTRILQLLPGSVGSALHAKLIVADIVLRPGLALHKDRHLISRSRTPVVSPY